MKTGVWHLNSIMHSKYEVNVKTPRKGWRQAGWWFIANNSKGLTSRRLRVNDINTTKKEEFEY